MRFGSFTDFAVQGHEIMVFRTPFSDQDIVCQLTDVASLPPFVLLSPKERAVQRRGNVCTEFHLRWGGNVGHQQKEVLGLKLVRTRRA
jgi:hypothetical protein